MAIARVSTPWRCVMSSAMRCNGSRRRATTTTLTPRLATARAKASPRPSDAPSTTAQGPYFSAKPIPLPPSAHGPEERGHVLGEQLGLLHGGEVPPAGHHLPPGDVVVALDPRAREPQDLLRVTGHTCRDRDVGLPAFAGMLALPIETCRRGDRPGDPVEHHVRDQLIPGEGVLRVAVTVAPGPELLHDPGEEAGR